MSNSNTFNNNNLVQTDVNTAYSFQTFSGYINNMKAPKYSKICIFCSCKESAPLINDGSFRQCNQCKKQFKAQIIE